MSHPTTVLGPVQPAEDLQEDELSRGVGGPAAQGVVLLESSQEARLPNGMKEGGVLPEREGTKGEGPRAGVDPIVEGVGGPDVDLLEVAGPVGRAPRLDDVEVAIPSAVSELEVPTQVHFRCDLSSQ